MSWQDVYANGNAACGDALELATWTQLAWREKSNIKRLISANASTDVNHGWPNTAQEYMDSELKKAAWDPMHHELCDEFFLKIKSKTCIKVAPTSLDSEWFGQSWCYVSSQCQDLNDGVPVEGKAVSAKMCSEDEEGTLSKMSLTELSEWHKMNGLKGQMPLLVKMAYYYVGEDFKALEESPYMKLGIMEVHENPAIDVDWKHRIMRVKAAQIKGDVHVVYDYEDYHGKDERVVLGNTTYHVGRDTDYINEEPVPGKSSSRATRRSRT
jgi:hypothetical protein